MTSNRVLTQKGKAIENAIDIAISNKQQLIDQLASDLLKWQTEIQGDRINRMVVPVSEIKQVLINHGWTNNGRQ